MTYSLNKLYEAAAISKQTVWEHFKREKAELELIRQAIGHVDDRREEHPGEGLAKLYWQVQPEGMGRNRFCQIFKELGYGLTRRRNPVRTTVPAHKVFSNLIEGRVTDGPNQVWQSDITYIKIADRFCYLTFIVDVYTRRIIGYAVSKSLRDDGNIQALKMALDQFSPDQVGRLCPSFRSRQAVHRWALPAYPARPSNEHQYGGQGARQCLCPADQRSD